MKRIGFFLLAIIAAFSLAACGGGGGGSLSAGGLTPAATPKAWGTAALIETDNTGDAAAPQVAFDSSGNALAVWEQDDGTRFNIWARRFQ